MLKKKNRKFIEKESDFSNDISQDITREYFTLKREDQQFVGSKCPKSTPKIPHTHNFILLRMQLQVVCLLSLCCKCH